MHFVGLAASFHAQSLNRRLLGQLALRLTRLGHGVEMLDYTGLDSPSYRHDGTPAPEGVQRLQQALSSANGWLIAMPEYNWSMPGHLKNLIDWLSVGEPVAFAEKPILLASASPSLQGGVKGLLQLKQPLEALGGFCYPQLLTVSDASRALDEQGKPQPDALETRMETVVRGFEGFAARLNSEALFAKA